MRLKQEAAKHVGEEDYALLSSEEEGSSDDEGTLGAAARQVTGCLHNTTQQ